MSAILSRPQCVKSSHCNSQTTNKLGRLDLITGYQDNNLISGCLATCPIPESSLAMLSWLYIGRVVVPIEIWGHFQYFYQIRKSHYGDKTIVASVNVVTYHKCINFSHWYIYGKVLHLRVPQMISRAYHLHNGFPILVIRQQRYIDSEPWSITMKKITSSYSTNGIVLKVTNSQRNFALILESAHTWKRISPHHQHSALMLFNHTKIITF